MAANLLEEILAKLSPDAVSKISDKAGTNPAQTSQTISAALPLLLAALANNTSKPGGAEALSQVIERDSHGEEDLETTLERQLTSVSPGKSHMVDHLLGKRRGSIEQALAAKTGAGQDSIAEILKLLGPLVLGAVGKQKQNQDLSPTDLAGYLGQQKQAAKTQSGDATSMLFDMLDANDDGSVVDDVMRLAQNFLGTGAKG